MSLNLSRPAGLLELARSLSVAIQVADDLSILAQPVAVGNLVAPNALAVHPMEGCDGDALGRPGELTLRRYRRFAAGGAGLLWAEATAVVPEGRANPRQLWLNKESQESFAALIEMIRATAAEEFGPEHRQFLVAQLTHSGRYSRPQGAPHPLIPQHDPYHDKAQNLPGDWPVLEDEYLDQLQSAYVEAARRAYEAGFDAVDIKACHGYLVNELLACRQREGKYGGSFENRTRFLLNVVDRIHEQLGQDKLVVTRLGIYDATPYPYGWGVDKDDATQPDLTEPKRLVAELVKRGVPMINITIANPYYNPHYGRPFNEPIVGGYESPEHPLVGVARLIQLVGEIQKAFPDLAIVGTGYSWLGTMMPLVAAATKQNGLATFVGAGRMAFAYPDFARDILSKGKLDPNKVCLACSACTQIMRDGGRAGCVVRDNEVYGPVYERGRMSNRDNLVRLASECRQCPHPTCREGCPAGIDIPRFIKLFLDGDDRNAYELIREANLFPQICAELCPVEQQCEGRCLTKFIGDGPTPIAAIQRYLAIEANRNGWSKLRVPQESTGKTIAVVGAGPAGMGCAATLTESGHSVTVFDRRDDWGGVVESAIPEDRQSDALRNELSAVFGNTPRDRLVFERNRELDASFNLDSILSQGFDAVFVAMGLSGAVGRLREASRSRVWNALDFLNAAKTDKAPDLFGKRVAVIGGGNTAMDAAVTAARLGSEDVYIIYRRSIKQMPAWPSERDRALNCGVHFLILTQPLDTIEQDGRLVGINLCPTRLGKPDASGRRRPEPLKERPYRLDVDMVLEALGQEASDDLDRILPGVTLRNGLVETRADSFRTSRLGVFAGGDLVRGPSTVVAAVADGMNAAAEISAFLRSGGPNHV